ncbi:MAG: hypothetical protein IT288_14040 [Bdellovibrionales bacterium]|nr:hypothetical protein [Bdellovibrionales bacterium]
MAKKEEAKVIQLPVKRKTDVATDATLPDSAVVPTPSVPPAPAPTTAKRKFRFDRERSKVVLSASLVTILIGVTMVNKALLDDEPFSSTEALQANPSRAIASLSDNTSDFRNERYERQLARELVRGGDRGPASIGKTPSAEERLQFEFLEGRYALKMNDGRLSNLRFVALSEQPKLVENRTQFLVQYKELLPGQFDEVRLLSREEKGKVVTETYSLDAGPESIGKVTIEVDLQGRLLTLAVAN